MFEHGSMEKDLDFQHMETMSTCMCSMPSAASLDCEDSSSLQRHGLLHRTSVRRGTWPVQKKDLHAAQHVRRQEKRSKSLTAKDDLVALMSQLSSGSGTQASRAQPSSPWRSTKSGCATLDSDSFDLEAGVKTVGKKAAVSAKKLTQRQAAATMANMLIGVGMLSFPYGFKQAGIGLGMAILAVALAAMTFTAFLIESSLTEARAVLVAKGESPTDLTLATLGYMAYGTAGRSWIAVSMIGELSGGFLTYVLLQAENLQLLFGMDLFRGTILSCLLSFICLLCPPKALSRLSSIGLVAVSFAAISLVISAVALVNSDDMPDFNSYHAYVRPAGTGTALGLTMFSLSGHAQIGYVYTNMARPETEFRGAVKAAMAIAGFFYVIVGILGYYVFGDYARQTLTDNLGYDLDHSPVEGLWWIGRLTAACFVVKLQATTPLQLAPVLELLYKPFTTAAETEQGKAQKRRAFIVAVVASVSLLACTFLRDSVVFSTALTGDVFAISTDVVFPALVALRLSSRQQTPRFRLLLKGVAVVGVLSALAGFGHVIHGYLQHDESAEITEELLFNATMDFN
eukprot:TRINITY_DN11715_c0_g1_i5.p1 TRINITY_DN11715_c0_g1~~TRINITY_DN11715_c0_g1_i5.p1  ORF type:complete len:587 (-),score=115.73 TRINITY_DN11715_c0_g1_i5:148-1857(-)